ncbi:MAG: hypothetical protein LW832_02755 [Parachlamydia sp.]|jgi:hypothetical protein|nr:hypothetical protein [Parachlamydia sp.]
MIIDDELKFQRIKRENLTNETISIQKGKLGSHSIQREPENKKIENIFNKKIK